jgi:Family of unknown function (DUF5681)
MKFTKGKSGNPKGRPKTTDTSIRELVSRDSIKAYKLLWKAMQANESWAIEIFFRELVSKSESFIEIDSNELGAFRKLGNLS